MSYFGVEPGDMSASEMHDHEPIPVRVMPCPDCQMLDGSPNAEYLDANGQCTFGCGSVIDNDHKVCLVCQDHSANAVECDTCGTRWERWSDQWERAE